MHTLTYRKCAIVGTQGYSGLELTRLLLLHSHAELAAVFSRDADWQLCDALLPAKPGPYQPAQYLHCRNGRLSLMLSS